MTMTTITIELRKVVTTGKRLKLDYETREIIAESEVIKIKKRIYLNFKVRAFVT